VGRARRSGTNSALARGGPRDALRSGPAPVGDGYTTSPPPVAAGVGSCFRCCTTVRGRPMTGGPVGIHRTANTATTRPYPAKRTTVKYTRHRLIKH